MTPWLGLTLFVALGADPRPQSPTPFISERFREHVAYLASDELGGRDVGSEGSAKAVQYLGHVGKVTVSRLTLLVGDKETSFPLTRDTYTLGRHRNNDIVISDPKVSSFHARLDRSPEGFVLVDLKSRNGSYVNGQRIDSAQLSTGDEIRLGTARLAYKVDYISSS